MTIQARLSKLLEQLSSIRAEMIEEVSRNSERLGTLHPSHLESARNLLHYLTLRRQDLRPLQAELSRHGLSSMGSAESHVMPQINAIVRQLELATKVEGTQQLSAIEIKEFGLGEGRLAENTKTLFGDPTTGRRVRIMVTMPSEAANDRLLVHEMLRQGMDCMRINCAHDDVQVWSRMIENLRHAEKSLGRKCSLAMDLAGPKLRTGAIEPGPQVVRARPSRDEFGRVTRPTRIWLTSDEEPSTPISPADAILPVDQEWLEDLHLGESIRLVDARGSKRILEVMEVGDSGVWVQCGKTCYFATGTVLHRSDSEKTLVGDLPSVESLIQLVIGDPIILSRKSMLGRKARFDNRGQLLTPATIGCSIPEVLDDVKTGESIWFDDGKIGGVVESVDATKLLIRITHTNPKGGKLRADKGINLPDSNLRLPAMTAQDLEHLEFIAEHADLVELSFANSVEDVRALQKALKDKRREPAIVLKVETRKGFENLPELLLAAMESERFGVMIARGDLGVECGFERLAEVQEEILWFCEAAHAPVIWATQVLESMTKKGMPSRAEISDVVLGHRAECVMLNKGQHIVSAIRVLDDILRRMQAHQAKKKSMLRRLRLAHRHEIVVNTSKRESER